ncbi:unnamed protein product [Ophioblennius macclurei]
MAYFNSRQINDCMAEGAGHPVYVVDTHATRPPPPLPPRGDRRPKRGNAAQTVLFILVSMALCGLVIQGCFIYSLSQSKSESSPISSKQIGGEVVTPPPKIPPYKPVAHLEGVKNVSRDKFIIQWEAIEAPILHKIGYRGGRLIIFKEGYYYVYSKVVFRDSGIFYHHVKCHSRRAAGDVDLLLSRKYSPVSATTKSNSFLGGVFYLYEDDEVFVSVSDGSKIEKHKAEENVLGAYMI